MKYKWIVQPEPVGHWRSFERRGWPDAWYTDERESICASVECEDVYVPCDVKTGNHAPLTLRIADYSRKPFKWMKAKRSFATLPEAKEALATILKAHPHFMPEEK